ncbi:unnamed protein product, partial [Larinioides sclopetarius]
MENSNPPFKKKSKNLFLGGRNLISTLNTKFIDNVTVFSVRMQ